MAESTTFVYDATDLVLGRLASTVAKHLLSSARAGEETRVIIVNAEKAVVSGKKDAVIEAGFSCGLLIYVVAFELEPG